MARDPFVPVKRIIGVTTLLAAADDNLIVTSVDMKVGALTVAAQPGTPSRLSFKMTNGGNPDTPGTATIVGTDSRGNALTEVKALTAAATVWTLSYFKTVATITLAGWVVSADTTKDTIIVGVAAESGWLINGESCTFQCVSGNIYINPLAVAVADATAFKLSAGMALDFVPKDLLSIIADGTAATYQILVWDA